MFTLGDKKKLTSAIFVLLEFWLLIAAEGVFCCYNSSLVLCVAEMLRESKRLALALSFEVNREGNDDVCG